MNHTRNEFKKWLKEAKYKDVLEMYQTYKEKLMDYRFTISKIKQLYERVPGTRKENIKIVKWKYNLLTNKLNLMVIKNE